MGEQSNRPQNAPFRFLSLLSFHRLRDIFHIPTANGPINTFPTCFTTEGKRGSVSVFPSTLHPPSTQHLSYGIGSFRRECAMSFISQVLRNLYREYSVKKTLKQDAWNWKIHLQCLLLYLFRYTLVIIIFHLLEYKIVGIYLNYLEYEI